MGRAIGVLNGLSLGKRMVELPVAARKMNRKTGIYSRTAEMTMTSSVVEP